MSIAAEWYIGSLTSEYWMPPATFSPTTMTSRKASPPPRRFADIASRDSGSPHQWATDGSESIWRRTWTSSGPPGRRVTRFPTRTGRTPGGEVAASFTSRSYRLVSLTTAGPGLSATSARVSFEAMEKELRLSTAHRQVVDLTAEAEHFASAAGGDGLV